MLSRKLFSNMIHEVGIELGKEIPAERAKRYYRRVRDLTNEQFIAGMDAAMAQQEFQCLPMPAVVRRLALGDIDARAMELNTRFRTAIRQFGSYAQIDFGEFENVVIRRLGSWTWLCQSSTEQLDRLESQLVQIYKQVTRENNFTVDEIKPIVGAIDPNVSVEKLRIVLKSSLPSLTFHVQPARLEEQHDKRPKLMAAKSTTALADAWSVPPAEMLSTDKPRPARPIISQRQETEQLQNDRPKLPWSAADAARLAALRDKQNAGINPPKIIHSAPTKIAAGP